MRKAFIVGGYITAFILIVCFIVMLVIGFGATSGQSKAKEKIVEYTEQYLDRNKGYIIVLEHEEKINSIEYYIYKVVVLNDGNTREYNYVVSVNNKENKINLTEIRE